MGTGRAQRTRSLVGRLVAATATTLAIATPAAADHRPPSMHDARAAARAAVIQHPSYRSIRSNSGLVMRACWRSGRAVRCSLHRWAPNPCALDGLEGVCAQVMTRRTWIVEARRRRGRTVARVVRVTDSSAEPIQSARARSSV